MEIATDSAAPTTIGGDATESRDGGASDSGRRLSLASVRGWFLTPLPYLMVVAALVRAWSLVEAGGFRFAMFYDDGVYYSAGTALAHGLMPYRDFALVHPPGSTIAFAPFGFLAEFTSDSTAFALARAAVICLGVLNTALIYRVGKSVGSVAATTAALVYAVWFPVVYAERSTLLEPFVILGTLGSLALLFNTKVGGWRPWTAGVLAGIGISTKLWAVIPVLIILGAVLLARRFKDSLKYVFGAVAAATVLMLPFLLAAPSNMFQMIVTDQLGRSGPTTTVLERFSLIFNLGALFPGRVGRVPGEVVVVALVLVAIAALAVFIKFKPARLWVVLLAVQLLVLLSVPVFHTGYPSFAAPALILIFGAFAQLLWNLMPGSRFQLVIRVAVAAAVLVGVGLCAYFAIGWPKGSGALPQRAIGAVAGGQCVAADRPSMIVMSNKLTSSLDNDCPIIVDFSGAFYSTPEARQGGRNRVTSPDFQAGIQRYFKSSDYVMIGRGEPNGMSPETLALLKSRPVVFKSKNGDLVIYGPRSG